MHVSILAPYIGSCESRLTGDPWGSGVDDPRQPMLGVPGDDVGLGITLGDFSDDMSTEPDPVNHRIASIILGWATECDTYMYTGLNTHTRTHIHTYRHTKAYTCTHRHTNRSVRLLQV